MKKIKYKKDVKDRTNLILFLLFVSFTLSLSVGYAILNSELKISGEAAFRVQADIRIEDISLYETTNLAAENYTSKYSKDTITIGTKLTQVNSTISYKVKVQNSGTVAMWIDSIEEEVKNNSNTEYVLEGIGLKELINPGEEKEFIVKIKYKDNITTLPDNTNLDTILKFNFIKPESVLARGSGYSTDTFFNNGPITKNTVESITFLPTIDVVADAIGSWDASYDKNGTVIASYKDNDENGLYELYIGGIGVVNAPSSSASLFESFLNVKSIDFNNSFSTSNVTDMFKMFRSCKALESIDLSSFNTSNVTDMRGMFSDDTSLKSLDLSSFDVSRVKYFGHTTTAWENGMFYNCKALTSLNVKSFNTNNAISINCMFMNCSSLTTLDISNFDTSNIIYMANAFSGCSKLTELDLSNFNTSKVTIMSGVFGNCSSLTTLDLSNFDTSNVTSLSGIFNGCSKLTELDLSNFNTAKVTDMSSMFANCSSLKELNLSSFDTSNVKYFGYNAYRGMFYSCSSLENIDLSNFNTSNAVSMSMMFTRCSSLKELDVSNFDTSNVTDMQGMFGGCKLLTKLDLSNFNTSKVTLVYNNDSATGLFTGCSNLKELNLSSFDTSNISDMRRMFRDCTSLESIDLSNFDTSKVWIMANMFQNCSSLTSVDLSSFDTSKLINTSGMFAFDYALKNLDLSSFDFSKITDYSSMFERLGSSLTVYVSNEDSKNFINNANSSVNCVIKEA